MTIQDFDNQKWYKNMPVWIKGQKCYVFGVDFINNKISVIPKIGADSGTSWDYSLVNVHPEPTALDLIAAEREKQISKGDTAQSDSEHNGFCELSHAAIVLADPYRTVEDRVRNRPEDWDYDRWVKMCSKDVKSRLIIAGALIAAELDRMIYEENQSV